MQGKLIKVEKNMQNGVHHKYTDKFGEKYHFYITLQVDDKEVRGGMGSPKQEPSWKIGDEYNFETYESNGFVNIKGLKPVDGYKGKSGSKEWQPKRKVDYKADFVSYGMSYVMNGYKDDKIDKDKLKAMYDFVIDAMWAKIDSIEGLD